MIEPWPGTLPMTDDSQPTEKPTWGGPTVAMDPLTPDELMNRINARKKEIEEGSSLNPEIYIGSQEVINVLFGYGSSLHL